MIPRFPRHFIAVIAAAALSAAAAADLPSIESRYAAAFARLTALAVDAAKLARVWSGE